MNNRIKCFLLLLGCMISIRTSAQNLNLVTPITITISNNPPANTEDWARATPPVMIRAQAKQATPNGTIQARVLVSIKKGGAKICGDNTPQTAPLHDFDPPLKIWTGANLISLLGTGCTLAAGDYELCVQFFDKGGRVLLGENCKPFTIPDRRENNFSPPQNILPVSDKKFTEQEAKALINFRWTPVVPKPKEAVTYRLKVWQLMQGQNGIQAMRSSQPLVTKDADNITQLSIANLLTGPCKPPYLCDFVWNVEALNKEQGANKGYGMSAPTMFSIQSGSNVNVKNDSVFCRNQNGAYPFKFTILNNDAYNRTFNSLSVYSINAIVQGTAPNYLPVPASQLTPGIGTVIPANGSLPVSGYINYAGNINDIVFLGQTSGGIPPKNGDFDFTDTLNCGCSTCDNVHIKLTAPVKGQQNNNVTITQPVSTLTLPANAALPVKSISAEILYFDIVKNDTLCYRCEKNSAHFGKFVKTTMSNTGFTNTTTLPFDEVVFTTTTAQALNNTTIDFEIAAPDINKCCSDTINVCIRYSIVTQDCKTCSVTQCYKLPRSK